MPTPTRATKRRSYLIAASLREIGRWPRSAARVAQQGVHELHARIIGEGTYAAARDAIEVRRLGEVTVKGKTRPVVVYELLALKTR